MEGARKLDLNAAAAQLSKWKKAIVMMRSDDFASQLLELASATATAGGQCCEEHVHALHNMIETSSEEQKEDQ